MLGHGPAPKTTQENTGQNHENPYTLEQYLAVFEAAKYRNSLKPPAKKTHRL
jgi:hypothetical protein